MKFIGDRGAPDLWPTFEYERPKSRLREVEGGDQPVVAPADDDDVAPSGVVLRHG
jgi:hypothetical protein